MLEESHEHSLKCAAKVQKHDNEIYGYWTVNDPPVRVPGIKEEVKEMRSQRKRDRVSFYVVGALLVSHAFGVPTQDVFKLLVSSGDYLFGFIGAAIIAIVSGVVWSVTHK